MKRDLKISSMDVIVKRAKLVRMANLCVIAGHSINGVAEIHSEIVKKEVFSNFYEVIYISLLAQFIMFFILQ